MVVLLAHANPLLLMCPVDPPQLYVELGLHQLLLPMEAAGGWVSSLMVMATLVTSEQRELHRRSQFG
jgi:hypothetical protein